MTDSGADNTARKEESPQKTRRYQGGNALIRADFIKLVCHEVVFSTKYEMNAQRLPLFSPLLAREYSRGVSVNRGKRKCPIEEMIPKEVTVQPHLKYGELNTVKVVRF